MRRRRRQARVLTSDSDRARARKGRTPGAAALAAGLVFVIAATSEPVGAQTRPTARDQIPGPVPARVVEVLDGDTVAVEARIWLGQSVQVNVRLAGVDSPERKGDCPYERALAERARTFTAEKLAAQTVELRQVIADKYGGRVIAKIVTATGEDMGQALIAAGLARAYDGGRRRSWCEGALSAIDPAGVGESSFNRNPSR
jgi:endonuclease YncB( thermonuclease family)